MKFFLDTSALLKIYHREAGTAKLLEIYKTQKSLSISQLARIEFVSAIHRKLRDAEIDNETAKILKEKFEYDIKKRFEMVYFSSFVIDEAYRLICKFSKGYLLRTLDSLQLAFFITYHDQEDIFVCSDKKLGNMAQVEGYKIWIPEDE